MAGGAGQRPNTEWRFLSFRSAASVRELEKAALSLSVLL